MAIVVAFSTDSKVTTTWDTGVVGGAAEIFFMWNNHTIFNYFFFLGKKNSKFSLFFYLYNDHPPSPIPFDRHKYDLAQYHHLNL